ncbi:hypothetical protein GURASL_34810 [Geotalea uraniireducens]|uniref:Uncharacterized protein n=1 Tax=Geotalea uraniireducens TaxID=351604 RepID=A0ABM8EQ12_9BACT|nr:hypothetical protein [Geotalea uraniireducens]BDV44558.1 hypothetical protein GURASL_34810 [Geotalea uraniireducens]
MSDTWSSLLAASRPEIAVAGAASPAIQIDLQSLVIRERADGATSCEITLNNWSASGGYLFADSAVFDLGHQLRVTLGTATLFSGAINRLGAGYRETGGHTLTVVAETKPVTRIRRRVAKSWSITLGQALREAALDRAGGTMAGAAVAEVNGSLHVGDAVTLQAVLPRFAGTYTVTEVRHLFDLQAGLRTGFSVSRPA